MILKNGAVLRKLLIFGNSGSGKSTLAKKVSETEGLAHLDLDTLAWLKSDPPQRRALQESASDIKEFMRLNSSWVIEGCYSDLLGLATAEANEMIFLNLTVEQCIENAKSRPWESHKYSSKEAQDKNLPMLINWISQYTQRSDTFSKQAHTDLYDNFSGKKLVYTSNR